MRLAARPKVLGYVKVELVSRSPRRWGWSVRSEAAESILAEGGERADACAESAWRDGQVALAALEAEALERAAD